jgi:hypothetical protein
VKASWGGRTDGRNPIACFPTSSQAHSFVIQEKQESLLRTHIDTLKFFPHHLIFLSIMNAYFIFTFKIAHLSGFFFCGTGV